jgi:hypothetical protein
MLLRTVPQRIYHHNSRLIKNNKRIDHSLLSRYIEFVNSDQTVYLIAQIVERA